MNNIEWLQTWYRNYCDGAWEHTYGIEIGTLDNPGWYIRIDLTGTDLLDRQPCEYSEQVDENDWMQCKVKDNKFYGYGDPKKLARLIGVFKDWVESKVE